MKVKQMISGIIAISIVCGLTACKSEETPEAESTTTTINTAEFNEEDKELINNVA